MDKHDQETNLATTSGVSPPVDSVVGRQISSLEAPRKIGIACAARIDKSFGNREFTWQGLAEKFMDHRIGSKDGECYLQGTIADGLKNRVAKSMLQNNVIVLDLDKGDQWSHIVSAVEASGLECIMCSTHSHLKSKTEIARDQLVRFTGNAPDCDFTAEEARRFLIEEQGLRADAVGDVQIVDQAKITGPTTQIVVQHGQIEKYRLVFPLAEPFIFRGKFDQLARIEAWSGHYVSFANSLGLNWDKSCKDASRAFFFSRHPRGATPFVRHFKGNAVRLEDYQRDAMIVSNRTVSKAGRKPQTTADAQSKGSKFRFEGQKDRFIVSDLDLYIWNKQYHFRPVAALKEAGYDCRKGIAEGKASFCCPWEGEHSDKHGTSEGCYAEDFDAPSNTNQSGFKIACSHSHGDQFDRLDFLKALIDSEQPGALPVEFLTDPRFASPKMTLESAAERVKQLDPKDINAAQTLAKEIAVAPIDSALKDAHLTSIAKKSGLSKRSMQSYIPKATVAGAGALEKCLESYNERFAVARLGSSAVVLDLQNTSDELDYFSIKAFQDFKANDRVKVDDELVPIAGRWLQWQDRRTYQRIEFEPSNPTAGNFNLFKGFKRVASDGAKDWSLIKSHLHEVLCGGNENYFNWLMTWFANIIQKPGEKPGSAVVIRGGKGSGKSIIIDAFAKLLQPYTFKTAESEQVIGKFNWHLSNKLLLIAEEATFAGDTKADSAMKNLITSKEMGFEKKGHDSIMLNNYLRLVMISNEDWIIQASRHHERRYFVLQAADTFIGNIAYFERLLAQLEDGGLSGFRYALESWVPPYEAGWNALRTPPMTEWLLEQAELTTPPWDNFFIEAIENGFFEGGDTTIELYKDRHNVVKASLLFEAFTEALGSAPYARNKASTKTMAVLVRKHMKAEKDKRNDGVYYIIPPLAELNSKKSSRNKFSGAKTLH